MAAVTPFPDRSSYSTTAADFQTPVYRINVILQSINARITALEAAIKSIRIPDGTTINNTIIAASADGYSTVVIDGSGNFTLDLNLGLNQAIVMGATAGTVLAPIFSGGSIIPGSWFKLYLVQDGTGGRAAPVFTGGANGFASDVATQVASIVLDPDTQTVIQFLFHPNTYWRVDFVNTGLAIT